MNGHKANCKISKSTARQSSGCIENHAAIIYSGNDWIPTEYSRCTDK